MFQFIMDGKLYEVGWYVVIFWWYFWCEYFGLFLLQDFDGSDDLNV